MRDEGAGGDRRSPARMSACAVLISFPNLSFQMLFRRGVLEATFTCGMSSELLLPRSNFLRPV
jgi:hypothetical protein